MKLRALWFVAVACVGLSPDRSHAQGIPCSYEVAHVIQAPDGPFGASPTGATAISPNGWYVCGSFNPGGIGFDRAFVYDTATKQFIILPLPPGGYQSGCNDVNDAGLAVGSYWISGSTQPQRGFVYDITAGQYIAELLPLPGASWCAVTGINSSNTLCGWRSIGSKGDPVNPLQAFVFTTAQGFVDLGVMNGPNSGATDITDDGTVVGWTGAGMHTAGTQAFVRANEQLTLLPTVPNGVSSAAVAAGLDGAIAVHGRMQIFPAMPRGFRYSNGAYVDVGILQGFEIALAQDIGDGGVIVGVLRQNSPNLDRGFIWQNGLLRDLHTMVPVGDSLEIIAGTAISPSGQIVAGAHNEDSEFISVILAPVFVLGDTFPDCQVNIDDLLTVIQWWGPGHSPGDANGDGVVGMSDLLIVINNWTF